MRYDLELYVEVTSRTTTGSDFALRGEVNTIPGADPSRNLDVDGSGGADSAIPGAFHAWLWDYRAVAAAGGAGLRGPDIADEGSLHMGDVPLTVAGRTPDRSRALRCPRAVASRAEYGGIDPKRLRGAEGRFGKLQIKADQGVLTAPSRTAGRVKSAGQTSHPPGC